MTPPCHAIVTGGGSGIGCAIAAALSEGGHFVTIMGRDQQRLGGALAKLPRGHAIACDVSDADAVAAAFTRAAEAAGSIGILVNCAGVVRTAPFEKAGDEAWTEMWRTNVMGCVYTSRAVLPAMRTMPAARIINVASTAALKGYAYVAAYAASKHALLGLTRSLALELAATGITVNAICPGYADTEIIRQSVATIVEKTDRSEAEARAAFTGTNPQGRLIDPDEVAGTVMWLASEAARSVTGQAIVVAGGEIM